MIPEPQQERAVLYALGLLDAEEAAEFESLMVEDDEMRELARDCHEASAALALAAGPLSEGPSAELKHRILGQLEPGIRPLADASETVPLVASSDARKIVRFPSKALPWALAAMLMVFCGLLAMRQGRLQEENRALSQTLAVARSTSVPDLLKSVAFCQMEPTAVGSPEQPRAAVAWDPARQEGVLQIIQLTPPASNKDYQLWVVEDGRKAAVSAGVVHVDAQGHVQTVFKPESTVAGGQIVAFALSLEKAGGSPTNAGPILLMGKL